MITVLSPAKKLSKECDAHNTASTLPDFLDESKQLVSILKNSEPGDLQSLMGISAVSYTHLTLPTTPYV